MLDPFDQSTWDKNERSYFDSVMRAHVESSDILISNGKPEHAAFLLKMFLDHTKDTLRIFSGSLARSLRGTLVFENPNVIAAATSFFNRGCSIRVVLEGELDVRRDERWMDHPLVVAAKEANAEDRCQILKAANDSLAILRKANLCKHWMTMDESAYRLEHDPHEAKAVVNFGNVDMAKALATIFDRLLYRKGNVLSASV